jgi:hypothetical protein
LLNVSTLTYECFFLFKIQFSFIRLAISVSWFWFIHIGCHWLGTRFMFTSAQNPS